MKVFVIMFHNYEWEDNDQRIVKICLIEDVAKTKLSQYNKGVNLSEKEYYIREYDLEIGDCKVIIE